MQVNSKEWKDKYFTPKALAANNKKAKWYRIALFIAIVGAILLFITNKVYEPGWAFVATLIFLAELVCFVIIAYHTIKYVYYSSKKK